METHPIRRILPVAALLIIVVIAVVYLTIVSKPEDGGLRASGTVEAVEVVVACEIAGRVVDVKVGEGDVVQQGDLLIRLDDELLLAQRSRADAAVEAAEAAVMAARANLKTASIQAELTHQAARMEELPIRDKAWEETSPGEFTLPGWYFEESEQIAAAEAEVDAAREAVEIERSALEALLQDSTFADLLGAEARLADARAAFLIAEEVRDRARRARDDEALEDFAEDLYNAAEDELEAAQSDYDQLLSEKAASDVLEVRARLAVMQDRYDSALDRLIALQTGEYSLQVKAADAALEQTRTVVAQAEATLAQAQAELTVIDLQLEKLALHAPISGVVATRNVEPGEILQPGAVALTVDQLDELTIEVYLPEDRYGQVTLGQHAVVTVDSFPDETFVATVMRIADRAEYTPRNVQTDEGRRTTVFAVELKLVDPSGRLKPGMPADVDFGG
jgi:HlyD family secretion protein